jgi:hypothetical protein
MTLHGLHSAGVVLNRLDFPVTSGIMPLHRGDPNAASCTTNADPQRSTGYSSCHRLQSPGPPDLLACSGNRATAGGDCRASRGGCIYIDDRTPRTRLRIRPEIAKGGRKGDVFLPDALMRKLRRFWSHKAKRREGLQPLDPLFCSQSRVRISKRRAQFAFRTWQVKAGFERLYPFHALRHTAVTNVYRASKDLFLAQRFARHVSPLTTTIYTHPSDEELFERVRTLSC